MDLALNNLQGLMYRKNLYPTQPENYSCLIENGWYAIKLNQVVPSIVIQYQ